MILEVDNTNPDESCDSSNQTGTRSIIIVTVSFVHIMNVGYKAFRALKSAQNNRGLGINAKKCLYSIQRSNEAWGMRRAVRRQVNV